MISVYGEILSAPSTIPGVSKVLAWGVRHVLKRLLRPVAMLSCFNTSPPKPQNHHKNEKLCQKIMRNQAEIAADPPFSAACPSRHAHKRPICHSAVSVQKCLLSINWLISWKSTSHHKSLDAFVELMVRTLYSDKHGAEREPLNFAWKQTLSASVGKKLPGLPSSEKSPTIHPSSQDAFQACRWLLLPAHCKEKQGMLIPCSALMGREVRATSGTRTKASNRAFNAQSSISAYCTKSHHAPKYCSKCPRNLSFMPTWDRHAPRPLPATSLSPTHTFFDVRQHNRKPNWKVKERRKSAIQVGVVGRISFHLQLNFPYF